MFYTIHPSSVHCGRHILDNVSMKTILKGLLFINIFIIYYFSPSVLFLQLYRADISGSSFISVSLAPVNCVWDQRQRRCEGACVFCSFSTSASPLWLHARSRHPCSCQPPDADALEDRRVEQPRVSREEAEKRWRFHVNLSGRMSTNCSAAGNVRRRHICHICFISGIIIQRWRDGKWH